MLNFDAPTHTYRWNGVVVPSVTQVLEDVGIIDYSYIPWGTREMALERGRFVHEATHLDDLGDLDEGALDEELLPYLMAWRRFRLDSGIVLDKVEERGYHPQFGYAGTLDRTGTVQGSCGWGAAVEVLLDIKTSQAPAWARYQTAAYAAFYPDPRRYRRMAVELHKDETYKIFEYDGKDWQKDFGVFCAALTTYKVKRQCNPRQR